MPYRRIGLLAFILTLEWVISFTCSAEVITPQLDNVAKPINPHNQTDACIECHISVNKSSAPLRYKNFPSTCSRCHKDLTQHTSHPSDLRVPATMYRKLNRDFKKAVDRSYGRMGCIVCHDLKPLCEIDEQNPADMPFLTLRGPAQKRSDICYNCHSLNDNQKLNAHDQKNSKGIIEEAKCLICHPVVPKQLQNGNVLNSELHSVLDRNRSELCLNCHQPIIHPADSLRHSGKASPDVVKQINKMQEIVDVGLPLEPGTGRVYCATCHNPHDKGVIVNPRLDTGGDAERRLRYPKICSLCHDK